MTRKSSNTSNTPHCSQCGSIMFEEDNFCRYCGGKPGTAPFSPKNNINACVYGPPVTYVHTCTACGNSWTVKTLIGTNVASFCPKCGGKLETTSKMW